MVLPQPARRPAYAEVRRDRRAGQPDARRTGGHGRDLADQRHARRDPGPSVGSARLTDGVPRGRDRGTPPPSASGHESVQVAREQRGAAGTWGGRDQRGAVPTPATPSPPGPFRAAGPTAAERHWPPAPSRSRPVHRRVPASPGAPRAPERPTPRNPQGNPTRHRGPETQRLGVPGCLDQRRHRLVLDPLAAQPQTGRARFRDGPGGTCRGWCRCARVASGADPGRLADHVGDGPRPAPAARPRHSPLRFKGPHQAELAVGAVVAALAAAGWDDRPAAAHHPYAGPVRSATMRRGDGAG